MTGTILIVDDDEDILMAGRLLLKRHYQRVDTTSSPEQLPVLLAETKYDAILLDMNFSPGESDGKQGFVWLDQILKLDPEAVVVLITAHGGVDIAVKAMKQGATDFVLKPWENERLLATLSTVIKLRQSRQEAASLKQTNQLLSETPAGAPMLARSKSMQHVIEVISKAAPTDANVLILGENGTGKELAARAIHNASNRQNAIFVSVDLGSVPESLFESELFGHSKGAFTDARSDRIGRIQAADGGTLFLDEIGNLPLHLQAKLLTVLEARMVTPVGANHAQSIDVRVIAATNRPRVQLLQEAHFRQDLLFRLNTVEIELPPLKERRDDIADLVHYYIGVYQRRYDKSDKKFSDAALAALTAYDWPGNIRALKHSMERAVILSTGSVLEPADFQLASDAVSVPKNASTSGGENADADLNLERLERSAIEKALRQHRYNISHAAKTLGLTRAALYRRMEKYGL